MRRFLSTPTGWFLLLIVEMLLLAAFMRRVVTLMPDISTGLFWAIAGALIVVVGILNYLVRRRYLSDV